MMHRRRFLKNTAAVAFGIQCVPREVLGQGRMPPSRKLNLAGTGIGGQGGGVLGEMKGENIIALCDVDWSEAAGTFNAFPRAERFKEPNGILSTWRPAMRPRPSRSSARLTVTVSD